MKIGFFTDSFNPKIVDGVDVSISTFKKGLERLGQKVRIYAPKGLSNSKIKNPDIYSFRSIKVFKKPKEYLALPFLANPLKDIKELKNLKLDIAHAQTPFVIGFLAKYVASRLEIPLVYTHHTYYTKYAKFYLKEKVITPKLIKFLVKSFSNIADAVIAPSYKIKKVLRDYGVEKEIFVLPTGVDIEFFNKSPELGNSLRKKLNIAEQKKLLIFVGRVGKEKNPDFLLRVMKEIIKKRKDILLLVVGDGQYLEQLKILSKKLKLDDFVKFTGRVSHEQIKSYYNASDIFVFSSLTETQGLVVLEALATGLPVVALDDDVYKGIVKNGENGFLLKKHSPSEFAGKVIKLLDDNSLYQKFSLAARKAACNFSEEKEAKRLLEIYKVLIKKKKESLAHSRLK